MLLFGLLIGIIASDVSVAADSYAVPTATNQQITEHTVCQKVTNATGKTVFVPTKTSGEWLSFRSASTPVGITREACAAGTPCANGTTTITCIDSGFSCDHSCGFYPQGDCNDKIGCYYDISDSVCKVRCAEFARTKCEGQSGCTWSGGKCSGLYEPTVCNDGGCVPGSCSCNTEQVSCEAAACTWDSFTHECEADI